MSAPNLPIYYDLDEFKERYYDSFQNYGKPFISFLRDYLDLYEDIFSEYDALDDDSFTIGDGQTVQYEINRKIILEKKEWSERLDMAKFRTDAVYAERMTREEVNITHDQFLNSVGVILQFIEDQINTEQINIRAGKATQESDLQHHKFKSEFTFPEIMAILENLGFIGSVRQQKYNSGQLEKLLADMFGKSLESVRKNLRFSKHQLKDAEEYLNELKQMKTKDIRGN